jgi:hypothetical protein
VIAVTEYRQQTTCTWQTSTDPSCLATFQFVQTFLQPFVAPMDLPNNASNIPNMVL